MYRLQPIFRCLRALKEGQTLGVANCLLHVLAHSLPSLVQSIICAILSGHPGPGLAALEQATDWSLDY